MEPKLDLLLLVKSFLLDQGMHAEEWDETWGQIGPYLVVTAD